MITSWKTAILKTLYRLNPNPKGEEKFEQRGKSALVILASSPTHVIHLPQYPFDAGNPDGVMKKSFRGALHC